MKHLIFIVQALMVLVGMWWCNYSVMMAIQHDRYDKATFWLLCSYVAWRARPNIKF